MSEPAYLSRVTIDMLGGPERLAHLPACSEPTEFGVHSEVAEHYGVSTEDFAPQPATLDYVVAAWLASGVPAHRAQSRCGRLALGGHAPNARRSASARSRATVYPSK